jgi:putative membrane protein
MSGNWSGWPLWWGLWWLFPLGLFAFCVAGRAWWHRSSGWQSMAGRRPSSHEGALAILEERFARGEIEEDEFLRRRAALDAS